MHVRLISAGNCGRSTQPGLNAQTLNRVSYGYYSGSGSYGSMSRSDYMMYTDVTYGGNRYLRFGYYYNNPEYTVYASDYETSSVRSWLNGAFSNSLYRREQSAI